MNPSSEPVGWAGATTAVAVAAIPLLRAFHVNITEDQANAILGFLAAAIVFLTLAVRARVTPTDKAQNVVDAAYIAQPGDPKPTL